MRAFVPATPLAGGPDDSHAGGPGDVTAAAAGSAPDALEACLRGALELVHAKDLAPDAQVAVMKDAIANWCASRAPPRNPPACRPRPV